MRALGLFRSTASTSTGPRCTRLFWLLAIALIMACGDDKPSTDSPPHV